MAPTLERILCVEDEPTIHPVIRLALKRVGNFDVRIYDNGEQALTEAPAFRPDLLVLDVVMPDMDGPAVLEKARQMPELANVPVIFLTGKSKPADVERLRALGAVGVIGKPFEVRGLAAQIQHIWDAFAAA